MLRETLDGLSRDTKGDCEETHCWERKTQGSQIHLREMTGDMGRSKIQGKEETEGGQGLGSKKETWKKGSEFAER